MTRQQRTLSNTTTPSPRRPPAGARAVGAEHAATVRDTAMCLPAACARPGTRSPVPRSHVHIPAPHSAGLGLHPGAHLTQQQRFGGGGSLLPGGTGLAARPGLGLAGPGQQGAAPPPPPPPPYGGPGMQLGGQASTGPTARGSLANSLGLGPPPPAMGMQPGMGGLIPPRPGLDRTQSVGLVGMQQPGGVQPPPGGPLTRAPSAGSAGLPSGGVALNGRMAGFAPAGASRLQPGLGGAGVPPPTGYGQQAGNDIMVLMKQGAAQQQGVSSGAAHSMFGGYDSGMHDVGTSFSMSEFPSLASSRPGSGSGMLGGVDMALDLYGAGAKSPLEQFNMQSEDFPALGPGLGKPGSGPKTDLLGSSFHAGGLDDGLNGYDAGTGGGPSPPPLANAYGNAFGLGSRTAGGSPAAGPGRGVGGPGMRGVASASAPLPPAERFGMLGLLNAIHKSDVDLSTLALGTDLTTLGMGNLNSQEPLYKTFGSPFAEAPCRPEPDLVTPACYLQQPPHLSPALFGRLSAECLLYVFYSSPGEDLQLAAAEELAQRGWMWHKELKAWLQRAQGGEPPMKTPTGERGSYLFFEVNSWTTARKDGFALEYAALDETPRERLRSSTMRG